MLAVFTAPDAVIIAAALGIIGAQVQAWRAARDAKRQRAMLAREFAPNGGSSLRDAINRIEAKIDLDVVPRLDHGARMIAEHADRLAILEARSKPRKATS